MRSLSTSFTTAQRAAIGRPLVKLEIASYGHPATVASTALQWSDFYWELLVSDSTTVNKHAVAMPADGSICRVRTDGVHIKYQRVTTPSAASDWTTWADWGDGPGNNPIGLAAYGTEVIAFGNDGVNLYYKKSTNSGSTFGSWTAMTNARPCERGCAAAFKANGDLAVVHASDFNDPTSLYIQKRTGGTWSTGLGQISGDFEISALALYHDGDWNMLALLLDGSNIRLARGIYGDGHDYSAGTWSGWEFVNSYKASVNFSGQTRLRLWRTQGRGKSQPTYYERVSAVNELRAIDNLNVDDPYITYHASLGAVFSFTKDNKPWFYRLRPGTAFMDSDWYKAWPLDATATYGLALCCDGTYLYAAAPNQVWRTALPGSWAPPTAGAGAGTNLTCNIVCTTNSQCQGGLICTGGYCRNGTCTGESDCDCSNLANAGTSIVITSPVNGATITTARPTFTGTSAAGARIQVTVNSATTVTGTATANSSGAWSWQVPSNLTNGVHTATFVAYDSQNRQTTATVTFTVSATGTASDSSGTLPVAGDPLPTLMVLTAGLAFILFGTLGYFRLRRLP